MRATVNEHLTDDEFSQLMDGAEPGDWAAAHLQACAACREELAAVTDSLGSFRAFSTAWAEVEAPRRVPVPARWLKRLQRQTIWGAGLAMTAITGLLSFWLSVPAHPRALAPVAAVAPTTSELAADNRLLSSIDAMLSAPGQPEVSAEHLHVATRRGAARAAVVED